MVPTFKTAGLVCPVSDFFACFNLFQNRHFRFSQSDFEPCETWQSTRLKGTLSNFETAKHPESSSAASRSLWFRALIYSTCSNDRSRLSWTPSFARAFFWHPRIVSLAAFGRTALRIGGHAVLLLRETLELRVSLREQRSLTLQFVHWLQFEIHTNHNARLLRIILYTWTGRMIKMTHFGRYHFFPAENLSFHWNPIMASVFFLIRNRTKLKCFYLKVAKLRVSIWKFRVPAKCCARSVKVSQKFWLKKNSDTEKLLKPRTSAAAFGIGEPLQRFKPKQPFAHLLVQFRCFRQRQPLRAHLFQWRSRALSLITHRFNYTFSQHFPIICQ